MITLLVVALAVNAVLHATIIFRYGVKGNAPPLVFGIVYVVLAVALALSAPYALWAILIVSLVGIVGLTLGISRITHDKSIERVIWVLDAAIILYTAYLLFFAR